VGIDPGMRNLVTLSNGKKVPKNSSFAKKEDQLARIQKGVSKNLELAKKLKGFRLNAHKLRFNPESKVARLHLKVSRQRKHENHQTSHDFVKTYSAMFWSDDNFKAQQNLFGKQIMSNAPGQLRDMIAYKSSSCGRQFLAVSNHNSTVTCHVCKALTGPCGRAELKVREWVCSSCGTAHDRDKNAAINTLNSGLEHSLEPKGLIKKLVNPPKKTK
jgi:putative transposase